MKELWTFQAEDVQRALSRNMLLAWDCGLGKTVGAIEVVKQRRAAEGPGPWLVLCRKTGKLQWMEFILEQDPTAQIIVTGTSGRWPEGLWELKHIFHPRQPFYVIAHHEALSLRKLTGAADWSKYAWQGIILDEAHRFKDRRALRSVHLKRLEALSKLALTGTPIESNPADLWSLLNWLYPTQFKSYWKFFEEWVEWESPYSRPDVRIPVGVQKGKAEEFARFISPVVTRRTKKDAAPWMPPLTETRVEIELPADSKQAILYKGIAKADDIEVKVDLGDEKAWTKIIPNVLAKIVRLQQCLSDPAILGVEAESAKIEWIDDYVEDNPNESIVVFTKFRPVAKKLADRLEATLCMGGVQPDLGAFNHGHIKILVGTIASMGETLNLQQATTAIFMEQEWSTIKMTQAVDRIHRADDTLPKQAIYLGVPKTVDTLVQRTLDKKWSEQAMVYNYLQGLRE